MKQRKEAQIFLDRFFQAFGYEGALEAGASYEEAIKKGSNSTAVVASDDFYILGILTSNVHRLWIKAQSSTLGQTIRYTPKTCFETFPFPQNPTSETVDNIRKIMTQLHEYRSQQMEKKQWGITKLYNAFFNEPSSKLYQLHQQLDNLVIEAYKFEGDDDILEKLLELNLDLTQKENKGISIIGPWSPGDVIREEK
jgi:hypothetical protein